MEGRQLPSWRLHDLRRTLRTGLGRLKVAPHVAELVLNHVKTGMTAVMAAVDGRATSVVPLRA
jgi:hypothetical protein